MFTGALATIVACAVGLGPLAHASPAPGAGGGAERPLIVDCGPGSAGPTLRLTRQVRLSGDRTTVTAVFTNAGGVAARRATFTEDLSSAADDTGARRAQATFGRLTYSRPHLMWAGDLAPGASASVRYVVRLRTAQAATRTVRADAGDTCHDAAARQATAGDPLVAERRAGKAVPAANEAARPLPARQARPRQVPAAAREAAPVSKGKAAIPFSLRYGESHRGGVARAGNAVVTCYQPAVPDCAQRQNGSGNNNVAATFIDVDSDDATFDSSTADLRMPAGAEVKYARLYWGARSQSTTDSAGLPPGNRTAPDISKRGEIRFRLPGGAYQTITAAAGDIGDTPTTSGGIAYGASADVTSLVTPVGNGTYTVANVQAARGVDGLGAFGGWSLVVAYRDPGAPLRNISVFDGFLEQRAGAADTNVDISGFKAPTNGAVTAQVGSIAYDGDEAITGDSLLVKTTNGPQTTLSDAAQPANNFFNSSIATLGTNVTARNPAYRNTLGYDSNIVDASAAFRNGDTSARFTFRTQGDAYWPHVLFSQIDLNQPKVELTKTAQVVGGGPAQPGAQVEYTINARSTGPDDAVGVVLTDSIPPNTTYVPGSLSVATGPNAGAKTDVPRDDQGEFQNGGITVRLGTGADALNGGRLKVVESTSVKFRVTLGAASAGTTVTNTATVAYGGSDMPEERTSTDATHTMPVAKVEIEKTASPANPKPGDTVTYTVKVRNPSTVAYNGVNFTDDLSGVLDDATYNNDQQADVGTVSYAQPKVTWTGNVAAGATATVTYSVTVENPPTGDLVLRNQVTSTTPGTNCTDPVSDARCTTEQKLPKLKVKKTVAPVDPKPGDKVTYTVTVENIGEATYTGASFEDDLTKVLDDATFNNDEQADVGAVSYARPKVSWSGDLAKGAKATITYSVTVGNPPGGDNILRNGVIAPGSNCVEGTDPECTTEQKLPKLKVEKTASPAAPKPGGKVTYTVTVENIGEATYTGASFEDDLTKVLDDATYNNDQQADVGAVSYARPKVTWTGDLAKGAKATITYSVTVGNPPGGDSILKNGVVSPGSNCVEGTDPECTTEQKLPKLKVKKTVAPVDPKPGDKVTYTVTVENIGEATYTGASFEDDLTKVLDDATFNNDEQADVGTVSYAQPKVSWSGDLAKGAKATITYSVTVGNPPGGDNILRNGVIAPGSNCVEGTDPDCTTVVPQPKLQVKKIASPAAPKPGGKVTYTVTVENIGEATYTGASFEDDLTKVLDDATFNNDQQADVGAVSYARPKVTWTGNLAKGAKATITYSVTVGNPPGGDNILNNGIVAPGSNCVDGTDPECTTEQKLPNIKVKKTVARPNPKPGDKVTYTVTVENVGEATYPGASFEDDLTNVLDDATYNNDQQADAGTVSYTRPKVAWSGDMKPGDKATITYSVTVQDPPKGDKILKNQVVTPPGGGCDPGKQNPDCTTTVPIPTLKIVKKGAPANPKPGDKVSYTVTVTNTGEAEYQDAAFTDDLTGVLDDATFNNDQEATSGTVAYAAPRLTWSGDVAKGDTVTVTYSVTLNDPVTGDRSLRNSIVSTSPGGNCKPGTGDPDCSTVIPSPDYDFGDAPDSYKTRKRSGGPYHEVIPGLTLGRTVTVENDAPAILDGLRDPGDDGVRSFGVLTQGQPSYTLPVSLRNGTGKAVTVVGWIDFDRDGRFEPAELAQQRAAPGQTGVRLTWRIRSSKEGPTFARFRLYGDAGVLGNYRAAAAPGPGPAGFGGSGEVEDYPLTVSPPDRRLHITKTVDIPDNKAKPKPGDLVRYTITVRNVGRYAFTAATPATMTDDLSKVLDDARYNKDARATGGKVSYQRPKLTWQGPLAPGQRVVITYSVTVREPVRGDRAMANLVTGPYSNCKAGSKDPVCRTRTKIPKPPPEKPTLGHARRNRH